MILRPEAQYEAVKIGLGMVSRVMYWLFPTLSLNAVIGLQKYYVPGKDEIDLLGDICDFDEDTYDFLDMCGQAKLRLLIKYVEVGSSVIRHHKALSKNIMGGFFL